MGHPQKTDCINPLDLILQEHDTHQELCNYLEEIADGLPDDVDQAKARHAVDALKYELPLHHRIEEEALFPMLMKYAMQEDNVSEIVARLNEEHVVDESFADELLELLEELAQGKLLADANMFGYMLRGFFENYRRHIVWENSIVLPLARRRLPTEGLQELASRITELRGCSFGLDDMKAGAITIDAATSHCSGSCEDCKKNSANR